MDGKWAVIVLPSLAKLKLPHRPVELVKVSVRVNGLIGLRVHSINHQMHMMVIRVPMHRSHVLMALHAYRLHGFSTRFKGLLICRPLVFLPRYYSVINRIFDPAIHV
ncbi:hypothetical protein ALP25_200063 [Pseudomonas syringae pv. syringae]|nr:hypothetical protein ALQ46_200099 [Pseudomonas savastanoi pv. phaseolicola]RMU61939.1 hypothetical protein ALP25_200063 [Pseudomonas syringae pv. syringae]